VLNRMVNRVGPTFVHRLTEMTGAQPAQIVRAYLATREAFCFGTLWKQIEALDNQVADAVQAAMFNHMRGLIVRATTWFLHPRRMAEGMQPLIARLTPAVAMLRQRLEPAAAALPHVAEWTAAGVSPALAQAVAATDGLFDALDIAEIAESHQLALDEIGDLHHQLGERLGLQRLHQQIEALHADSYWDALAKIALGDELAELQRSIALEVLSRREGGALQMLQAWESENQQELHSARRLLAELADAKSADLAMLSVALRKLRNLA
jgi:glutamate dehydrogenase